MLADVTAYQLTFPAAGCGKPDRMKIIMNKWTKLTLLLLPYALIGVGLLHSVTILVESESEIAISDFRYTLLSIMTGVVLNEFNKHRKDLS